jgi:hypothetical protein
MSTEATERLDWTTHPVITKMRGYIPVLANSGVYTKLVLYARLKRRTDYLLEATLYGRRRQSISENTLDRMEEKAFIKLENSILTNGASSHGELRYTHLDRIGIRMKSVE